MSLPPAETISRPPESTNVRLAVPPDSTSIVSPLLSVTLVLVSSEATM